MDAGASESAVFYDHFFSHWHVGDLAGIFGLIVSIVGFALAISQSIEARKQASLAKSAADQAKQAANEALNHRRLLDSNAILGDSGARLNELKTLVLANQFADTINRYDIICAQLKSISQEALAAGHDAHATELEELHLTLRKTQVSTIRLHKTPGKLKLDKIYETLSHVQDQITVISGQIRNIGSKQNGA